MSKTTFYNCIVSWGSSGTSSLFLTREAAERHAKEEKARGALDTRIERVERTLEAAISEIFQGL